MGFTRHTALGLGAALLVAAACSSSDENGGSENPQGGSGYQNYGGQQSYGGQQNPGGSGTGSAGMGTGNTGQVPPTCGNGQLDPGEACDATNLGGATCGSATSGARPNGNLSCNACQLNTNGCSGTGQGGSPGTGGGPNGSGGSFQGSGGADQGSGGADQGSGGSGNAGNGETGRMVGMTDAMNQVRHEVNTQTPLPDLTWSTSLAATAQAYADKLKNEQNCNMVHSHAPGLGENLAWFSGQPGSAQQSVSLWASEGDCYNYAPITASDSCPCALGGACGHYTQIVWRNTTEVGCGVASCGSSEIWVCNFTPPGNYLGQYPY